MFIWDIVLDLPNFHSAGKMRKKDETEGKLFSLGLFTFYSAEDITGRAPSSSSLPYKSWNER